MMEKSTGEESIVKVDVVGRMMLLQSRVLAVLHKISVKRMKPGPPRKHKGIYTIHSDNDILNASANWFKIYYRVLVEAVYDLNCHRAVHQPFIIQFISLANYKRPD